MRRTGSTIYILFRKSCSASELLIQNDSLFSSIYYTRILVLHACKVETIRFSDYLPLYYRQYQSGAATLGSDEYSRYDVYSSYMYSLAQVK